MGRVQISKRLRTIASFVTEGSRVADIGTDHAYIPIYLVSEGKAAYVLAMDVRKGPLKRAKEHIRERGLCRSIEVRQSDGLSAYREGEADSIVISGMGGALTVRILSEGISKCRGVKEWILSPQSELFLVRRWIREHGLRIERETMLCEDGKYYTVMRAVPGTEERTVRVEDIYGRYLLESRHPVLKEYLQSESDMVHRVLVSLETAEKEYSGSRETIKNRKRELSDRLLLIKEALAYYEM